MSYLVYDKPVTVEWSKHDRYGRIVGKVMVGSLDAGLAQITAALAWHYKQYAKEQLVQDQTLYAAAEDDAGAKRAGLWQDANPVPPRDFRKRTRQRTR